MEQAVGILNRCAKEKEGAISSQILGEFIAVVSRKIKELLQDKQLLLTVDRLSGSFLVLSDNAFIVREAARGIEEHQLSFGMRRYGA